MHVYVLVHLYILLCSNLDSFHYFCTSVGTTFYALCMYLHHIFFYTPKRCIVWSFLSFNISESESFQYDDFNFGVYPLSSRVNNTKRQQYQAKFAYTLSLNDSILLPSCSYSFNSSFARWNVTRVFVQNSTAKHILIGRRTSSWHKNYIEILVSNLNVFFLLFMNYRHLPGTTMINENLLLSHIHSFSIFVSAYFIM